MGRPGFMSVSCYRFFGHGRMDKSPHRSAEEEQLGRQRDPLAIARTRLLKRSLATSQQLKSIDDSIMQAKKASIAFTADASAPNFAAMFHDVYADGQPGPEPLNQRLSRVLVRIRDRQSCQR